MQQPEQEAYNEGDGTDGLFHVSFHARGDFCLKRGVAREADLHAREFFLLRQPLLAHG